MNILHISDLHNRREMLTRLKVIRKKYPNDHLLLTADVTHNGYAKEYRQMALWLDYWISRNLLLVCPGNHDAGPLGNIYSRACMQRFDRTFDTSFTGWNKPKVVELGKDVVVFLLDSVRETWWPGDFACGRIGWWQRRWLQVQLNAYRGKCRIVACHHHPFTRHPFMKMTDAAKLMKILRGRCEILCFGHRHKMQIWQDFEGIPFVFAAGATYKEECVWRIRIQDKVVHREFVKITE